MTEPVRMCVGCRGRAPKSSLVRLVWDAEAGSVVVDERAVLPGRGAYLHPHCVERAIRTRAVTRQLKLGGVDATALATQLRERLGD